MNILMEIEEPPKEKKQVSTSIDLSKVYGLNDLVCSEYANIVPMTLRQLRHRYEKMSYEELQQIPLA